MTNNKYHKCQNHKFHGYKSEVLKCFSHEIEVIEQILRGRYLMYDRIWINSQNKFKIYFKLP